MFSVPVEYSYLMLSLGALAVWAIVFYFAVGIRKQMLALSVFGLLSAFSELLFIPDYWTPVTLWSFPIGPSYISLEDFIFGFAFIGIVSALPALFVDAYSDPHPIDWTAFRNIAIVGAILFALTAAIQFAGTNSIYASAIAALIVSLYFVYRSDNHPLYIKAFFVGAVFMSSVMFFGYLAGAQLVTNFQDILKEIWTLYDTSLGWTILGVPVTEIIWGFCLGGTLSLLFTRYRV